MNTNFFFFVTRGIKMIVPTFNNYSLLPVLCSADFLMVNSAVLVKIYNIFFLGISDFIHLKCVEQDPQLSTVGSFVFVDL